MRTAERNDREQRALNLFLGGATYLQIARQLKLRTASAAHKIVEKALREAAQRRLLLSDEALAIHQERQERLLLAHWPRATHPEEPDHRSAELCRRLLAHQARLYGLEDLNSPLPAPTRALGDNDEQDADDVGPTDELARIRAARTDTA